ncbi:MAG TPA: hypothetical protein VFW30_05700 [Bryocella sp.]|nr:hypothetical protein [Bryocella sp.]
MRCDNVLRRFVLFLLLAGSFICPAFSQTAVSARQIDQFLAAKQIATKQGNIVTPPLNGLGSVFVNDGSQYSIDPRLIVAISGAESSFGVRICTSNNAWNWFWQGPCPSSPFDSWSSGIETLSHYMDKSYILHGYNSVALIGQKYCASGCSNWVPDVTLFMTQLGGDPSSLAWNDSGATTGSTESGSGTVTSGGTESGSGTVTNGGAATSGGTVTEKPGDGPTSLPLGSEQVLPPVATLLPSSGWWIFGNSASKVSVTAEVSGKSLIAGSVRLWQELPNQRQLMLAQLTAGAPGSNGGITYSGTATLNGAPPADLWVSASYKVGSKVQVKSSSLAEVAAPMSSSKSGVVLTVVIAVLILLMSVVVITLRHRPQGIAHIP